MSTSTLPFKPIVRPARPLPSRPLPAALSPYSRPFSPPSLFSSNPLPSPTTYLPSTSPHSIEAYRRQRRRPSQATRRRLLAQSGRQDTPPRFIKLDKYEGDASEGEWEVLGRVIRRFRKEMMMSEGEM